MINNRVVFSYGYHLSIIVPQRVRVVPFFFQRYTIIRHVGIVLRPPWAVFVPIGHAFAGIALIPFESLAVGYLVGIGSAIGLVFAAHAQFLAVINGRYATHQQV